MRKGVWIISIYTKGWLENEIYKNYEDAKRRFLEELSSDEKFDFIVEHYYYDILPTTLKLKLDFIIEDEHLYYFNDEDFVRIDFQDIQ